MLTNDLSSMRGDVHEIRGFVKPICDQVNIITNAIVEKGLNGTPKESSVIVMTKLLEVVKYLIIAVSLGGTISAVGYYGMKASGNAGDVNVELEKKP